MSLCGISRRRLIAGTAAAAALSQVSAESLSIASAGREAVVYQTTSLTAEGLVAALRSVQSTFKGRIAVKLHTGEPHGPNILPREWVKALINELPDAVIVETNTLYGGPRAAASRHRETLVTNGWTFAPVDILDEDGATPWPIAGGSRLKSVTVGSHLDRYDSMLVLTHFKGHGMAGFGGSLKNVAIGCASGREGKAEIHQGWERGPAFLERMADAGKAVTDHFQGRIAYINVLRRMSVDCDCTGTSAAEPEARDLGILASTDILAVDQASIDWVGTLPPAERRPLEERIASRSGLTQLDAMERLAMGVRRYRIESLG